MQPRNEVASLMRGVLLLASFFAAAVLTLATFSSSGGHSQPSASHQLHLPDLASSPPPSRPANVVVLETAGHHDEVTASFLYTLARSRHNTTALLRNKRFGVQDLYDGILPPVSVTFDRWDGLANYKSADVLVSVTCNFDMKNHAAALERLLADSKVRILCLVHKEDEWRLHRETMTRAQPWLRAGRLEWLVLSPHVRTKLQSNEGPAQVNGNQFHSAEVHVWPPIFPSPIKDVTANLKLAPSDVGFAIQGNFEPGRRAYDKVLELWTKLKQVQTPERAKAKLVLAGSGKPMELAVAIKDSVRIQLNLDYIPFYSTLYNSRALLPAFTTDAYYTQRASSTIGASFIAQVPLIASQRLLDAYQFLGPEDVYLREQHETEMDVVARILTMPQDVHVKKKAHLGETRDRILAGNLKFANSWTAATAR